VTLPRPSPDDPPLFGRYRYGTVFAVLLAAAAVFRLAYAPWVPLTSDELMHWEWSRHPALGYPEHPPLIAWLIAISTSVFGTSGWSVRLVPIVASTVMFAAAFRLGRELFGERAAFLGLVPLMSTPIYNAGGILANTDGLLACFWTLTVYAVKRAVVDERPRAWIAAGVLAGLALLSKLAAIFLIPATALFLALTPRGRVWLKRPGPYLALAISLLAFLPPLIWNARHDWFTISMRVGHQATEGFTLAYLAELIGAQLLVVTPLLFGWVVWGLFASLRGRSDPRLALLGSYMAVPFLFYTGYSVFARAGIHWPAIGYVTGFLAAGALTATRLRSRWVAPSLSLACLPAVVLSGLLYFIPAFPQAVTFTLSYWARPEKVSTAQLDNIFDWSELGSAIREVWDRGDGERFLLCREGYGLAGLVAFYTPGRPDVFLWELQRRNGAAYDLWRAEAELVGHDAVIVEDEPNPAWFAELTCCFDELSEPRKVEIERGGRVIREFYVVYGSNFSGFPDEGGSARGSGSQR
jgi:4-amino-4-deoxy-L-arabinose transferase-like glycosyltransferase